MTTDFFDRQDYARRQTRRLLVMFGLAVAAIVLAIYVVVAIALGASRHATEPARNRHSLEKQMSDSVNRGRLNEEWPTPAETVFSPASSLWNPPLFLGVALGTLLVIALGSLYKISELVSGGESVALMLGGRPINPQTRDLAERRLLNVVEEMALASGVPVPPVYVLDNEPSINAFAAGHQPGDAVVAVSAGALQYLSREELQGVMGHEFSHVLNGDMRLNLRLIGVVNGILVLAIIGYYLLRSAQFSSSRDSKNAGGAIAMLGLALVIFGYLGVFFGKLIKSAISRQREFLADASSVQFTRNPGGIAGALKKIGGLSEGSQIRDAHAEEISHMFFGNALAGAFFNLFATHPPLAERIRALEPEFDGCFPEVKPLSAAAADAVRKPSVARPMPWVSALPPVMAINAGDMTRQIGRPQAEDLRQAGQMVSEIPQPLLDAAREPFAAQAVIYTLLLSRDDEPTRSVQMRMLESQIEPPLYEQVQRLAVAAQSLSEEARLPLADLATPALKNASPQQYAQFRKIVAALADADGKVDLFEYCLRLVLFSYLDVHFGLKKPPAVRYRTIGAVAQPAALVLSMLAYVGQDDPADMEAAFQAGAKNLLGQAAIVPQQQCTLKTFGDALTELAQTSPNVKRVIIAGVAACIAADGQVTLEEGRLLKAVAAVLGCPMPPIAVVGG